MPAPAVAVSLCPITSRRDPFPVRMAWILFSCIAVCGFPAAGVEREVTPAHLVGEEDTPLLARVQDVIDDWDPRKLRDPYVTHVPGVGPDGRPMERSELRRRDLAEFVADVEAAEALGKAFFWDMQAGSDFRRVGASFVGTACATCHYRFGADARDTNTARVPYVVWDRYHLDSRHALAYGEHPQAIDPMAQASRTITSAESLAVPRSRPANFPFRPAADEAFDDDPTDVPRTPLSLIVGSQGVPRRDFMGLNGGPPADPTADWQSESGLPPRLAVTSAEGDPVAAPTAVPEEWEMFSAVVGGMRRDFRQITRRNSPTVVNAGFADRLFHDGRAESTFNGFSIFGDDDRREPIHVRREGHGGEGPSFPSVRVAITRAALASQAVGPVVNEVEMSYRGRGFPNLARKLLDAPVLGYQRHGSEGSPDGVLGRAERLGILGPGTTYRDLVKRAFRREWWDGSLPGQSADCARPEDAARVPLVLAGGGGEQQGSLLEANFSLFWGLSIMLYESGLVSNESPFDAMLQGDSRAVNERWCRERSAFEAVVIDRLRTRHPPPAGTPPFEFTSGAEVFQRGFRAFLSRGCHDCHAGPLFSEPYSREDNASIAEPIGRTIDRTLLPNSRGDAIGLAIGTEHRRVLARVADLLVDSGAARGATAPAFALELDLLREPAGGYPDRLENLVRTRLGDLRLPATAAKEIATALSSFERTLASHAGDRIFFTEDQRVAMAKNLVDGVLVEKTPIPIGQALDVRPRLPFAGPPSSVPYAFYDTGFYALGVAPPRYDRGIGEVSSEIEPGEEAFGPGDADSAQPSQPRRRRASLGSAYEFSPAYRGKGTKKRDVPRAAPTAALGHADDSWVRDVPAWPGDFPPGATPAEHASRRRADVHFLSRARRLVLTETTWGHRKPLLHDNELLFWGAFRVPTLRNVELTAPYMHNGRLPTLHDVLDFYDRGGDVPADRETNPDKHPAMRSLDLDEHDKLAVAFFLACLTDERVRHERAPFDHPELRIVNGYDAAGVEQIVEIPATGAVGGEVPPSFPAPR